MAQHNIYPMRWFLYLLEGRQRWGMRTKRIPAWKSDGWITALFTIVIMWLCGTELGTHPLESPHCVFVCSHSAGSNSLQPYGCDLIARQAPLSMGFQSSHSVQFSSVQLCPTLYNPMNCSTPGLPVQHQLLEFTQTHIHQVGDAIQPHPLSSPSPPAPNPSQHQSLFQWVNSSHEVAKVLEFQL